jgi:predicted dienelactone hydrolase
LGFEVAVIEHVGSNAEVLKAIHRPGMRQAELAVVVGEKARDPEEMMARPLDLAAVRRELCPQADWVGVGGHSFGTFTALAGLGCEMLLPTGKHRWDFGWDWAGVVLLSPPPPETVVTGRGLSQLKSPCLLLTGTRDSGMPAGVTYEQRLESFSYLPAGNKYAGLLVGADHMSLAGIGLAVAPVTETLTAVTGEFWTALQRGERPQWPSSLPLEVQFDRG